MEEALPVRMGRGLSEVMLAGIPVTGPEEEEAQITEAPADRERQMVALEAIIEAVRAVDQRGLLLMAVRAQAAVAVAVAMEMRLGREGPAQKIPCGHRRATVHLRDREAAGEDLEGRQAQVQPERLAADMELVAEAAESGVAAWGQAAMAPRELS